MNRRGKPALALLGMTFTVAVAFTGCQSELGDPTSGAEAGSSDRQPSESPTPAPTSKDGDAAQRFSVCMRENGVPEFPDPVDGRVHLPPGIDPEALENAERICSEEVPDFQTETERP